VAGVKTLTQDISNILFNIVFRDGAREIHLQTTV